MVGAVSSLLAVCVACQGAVRPIELGDQAGEASETGSDLPPDSDSTTTGAWGDTEESGDAGEGDEGGVEFVPMMDAICGPPAPGAVAERCWGCDPMSLHDCPDGEKCAAYATVGSAWDANKCVPIQGDGQPGDDCEAYGANAGVSGEDSCGNGSMCWDIDPDTQTGYCIAFCQGSFEDPECPDGAVCAVYNDGVLPLCTSMCDPLLGGSDCPSNDNACVPNPSGGGFVCILGGEGWGVYGTECLYVNSCNAGLYCAPPEAVPGCQGAQGCCSEFCDLDDPMASEQCSGYEGGQACIPWFEMGEAPAGFAHVGACAIP